MNYNPNNFGQNDNGGWDQDFYGQQPMNPAAMQASKQAASSQTLGIISLVVSIICCPLIGLILALMARGRAKNAKLLLGFEPTAARTGRICATVALILALISIVISIVSVYFYMQILAEVYADLFAL